MPGTDVRRRLSSARLSQAAQALAGGDVVGDPFLDGGAMLAQLLDQLCAVLPDPGIARHRSPAGLGHDRGDQIVATGDQLGQQRALRVDRCRGLQLQRTAHAREDFRIHPIGLGQLSSRSSELAGLAWIDLDVIDARSDEGVGQRALVAARSFEHDERVPGAPHEPCKSSFRLGLVSTWPRFDLAMCSALPLAR